MISIEEAFEKIDKVKITPRTKQIGLRDALNYCVAKNPKSAISMPPFNQSAMDGYAICGLKTSSKFAVKGIIKAGDDASAITLKAGEAYRIFTGAMVPNNCDAIAQQEIVVRDEETIELTASLKQSANIRPLGEQILENETIALEHHLLNPETISYLTTLGQEKITVFDKAKVGIIVTGDELQKTGEPLEPGKIYESNGIMLDLLCKSFSSHIEIHNVNDAYEKTKNLINSQLQTQDVVILTGGISVGDYDFVGKALQDLGVEELFYKVRQKPGKPLYVGKKGATLVFALPGNPAAAATCFHLYVKPYLKRFMGIIDDYRPNTVAELKEDYIKKGNRPTFLKAMIKDGFLSIQNRQSSAMLGAFASSNCFAFAPESKSEFKAGDKMLVYLI